MKKNKLERSIDSNFNRKEKFDLDNIPEHFDSVTEDALKKVQRAALDKVERVTGFAPGALDNGLASVDGQFEGAFATLEGDFATRLANLKKVYKDGLSEIRNAFQIYKLQVAQHKIAFERYSEANEKINGEPLPDNIMISSDDTKKIEKQIEGLE